MKPGLYILDYSVMSNVICVVVVDISYLFQPKNRI